MPTAAVVDVVAVLFLYILLLLLFGVPASPNVLLLTSRTHARSTNGSFPGGNKNKKKSSYTLTRRLQANGVKPGKQQEITNRLTDSQVSVVVVVVVGGGGGRW